MPIPGSGGGSPGTPGEGSQDGSPSGGPKGSGDGRWETSNEIPPPPDERGGAPGDGDGSGDGDGAFEDALGDFDGAIAREREGAAARSPGLPSDDAGGGTIGGGAGSDGSGAEDGEATQPGGFPTGGEIARAPAPPGRSGPNDIDTADARDDDIIARQLREAAMAESDPELKAALWEEYQRYKNN